jgi:geranylgeranyl reductase family protein
VVVGAGPSGSTAAAALVQKGHDVLLIDRKAFPRDKVCGDGIPASAIEVLYSLGMKEKVLDSNYYEIKKILLSSPRGYTLEAPIKPGPGGTESYVVPRLHFDALIQEHAVESGAEFLEAQVNGPIVEDGKVTGVELRRNGTKESVRAKIVVGADGVTSSIARALRPDSHEDKHRAVAMRAYIEDIAEYPHVVEFHLYNEILPGYAWIFALDEGRANIGLGMRLDKFRQFNQSLEELMDIFLNLPIINDRLKRGGILKDSAVWQLNFGSQNMQRAYDGALLIGDAAGLINPLTGGGISNGLQSAMIAAEVIHHGIVEGDISPPVLREYERRLTEQLKSSLRRSYFIQRSLFLFPMWVDLLIRWGGANSSIARTFIEKL